MSERLTRWGIGPKITVATGAYALAAGTVTCAFPRACLLTELRHPAVTAFAFILLAIGVLMWLAGVFFVMRAYHRDQLVTSGVFSVVRNPIYSAWIVLLLPAAALLSRSWPLLVAPLVAYFVFKRLIHVEDEYLVKRYGLTSIDYRSRVNEIVPIPRFWRA